MPKIDIPPAFARYATCGIHDGRCGLVGMTIENLDAGREFDSGARVRLVAYRITFAYDCGTTVRIDPHPERTPDLRVITAKD